MNGEPLCVKFFESASGVSARVLVSVIEDFKDGYQQYHHGLQNTRKLSTRMRKFICWMVSFAKLNGEHKPDDIGVIALPSTWTKVKLYHHYCSQVGSIRLCLSTFYQGDS